MAALASVFLLGLLSPSPARATGFLVCGVFSISDQGGSFSCDVGADGNYRLLFLYSGTQDGSIQVDGTEVIGAAALTATTNAATTTLALTSGSHTLSISGLDTGAQAQAMLIDEGNACFYMAPLSVTAGTSPVDATFSNNRSPPPSPLPSARTRPRPGSTSRPQNCKPRSTMAKSLRK